MLAFAATAEESFPPPSPQLESLVTECYAKTHDGWSVDEVLLNDVRRQKFVAACRTASQQQKPVVDLEPLDEDVICRAILHVRKRGGQLAKTTRLSRVPATEHDLLLPIAEITSRRLHDETNAHTDAILVNSKVRERFDALAESIAPGCNKYQVRKAALRLRKTRQLQPELLARITDWQRQIEVYECIELRKQIDRIPARPGVYLFHDQTGYLYIGQAANLRERLADHLTESDRKALANYLDEHSDSSIRIEVHIFASGSPGEDLRVRRAYESELIRTRKPRLNIAP